VNALHTAFAIYPEVPKPRIAVIPVPEFAPLSADVAKRWSAQYWPTTYKNANPYGPNPLEVARVEEELYQGNSVHHWMHLAKRVAEEGRTNGLGEPIGAVVVERSEEYGVRVVAVATDARRCGMPHNTDENAGNIMGHAVMRAIGLVAQKRRIVDGKAGTQSPGILSEYGSPPWSTRQQSPNGRRNQRSSDESVESHHSFSSEVICSPSGPLPPLSSNTNNPFLDEPMTFLESHYFAPATLQPRGYLCLQLEMYTTHEPCVMCTMALLHSRFGRVVFAQEMAQTGGLVVDRKDPSVNAKEYLRYGLFWRQELNWKFFCWQYSNGNKNTSGQEYGDDLEAQLTNLSLAPQESFEVALLDAKMHA
jgi:tRNA-specific adenosine deaminase 3